jgi:CBS-domain-containing membrane protein
MLTVADIMTREVFTLGMGTSIEEAAQALTSRKIGGAPVNDQAGRLVGFLSRSDLLSAPMPAQASSARKVIVADVMNAAILALPPNAPALEAAVGMSTLGIHHVMVVDDHGLVGMVSSLDLVKALARGLHFGSNQSAATPSAG